MRDVLIGQTDYTVLVRITGADGAPETGLAHTDIDIAYSRVETDNDVTTADVAPAALSALTDAHSDWGWEEVSSGDHPGLYRLDIADAVFASGAWEAVVTITDASGSDFYAHDIGFRLVSFNAQDGVRLGLTALPNAAAGAAGGLPTDSAGKTSFNDIAATAVVSGGAITTSGGAVSTVTTTTTATNLTNAPTNGDLTAAMKASVNTEVDSAIETYHLDHLLATTYDPNSKPGAADALLNELVENDGGVARYTANALEQAPTGGSAPTVEQIRTEMDDNSTKLAAILEDTAEIGAAGAGLTNINLPNQTMDITGNITGNLSGSVGSVTGAVGSVTGAVGGNDTGSVGSLATQAKADVNAEVLDVLNVDTFAEPGQGTPAATLSLAAKINYLFKSWRNRKTQTSTTWSLYNDDATTVDQKATVSDDGTTAGKTEVTTGP
jgi:hypothetical protein